MQVLPFAKDADLFFNLSPLAMTGSASKQIVSKRFHSPAKALRKAMNSFYFATRPTRSPPSASSSVVRKMKLPFGGRWWIIRKPPIAAA
jgi:hypothetical protein